MFFLVCCKSFCQPLDTQLIGRAYVKGHPADGFVFWDIRLLHQLQRQLLIVERDRDDNSRRRPSPNHKVVFHFGGLSNNSNSSNNSPASLQISAQNLGCEDKPSIRKFHAYQLSRAVIRARPLPFLSSELQQRGALREESWIK
jgi:hypothetical protein